MCIIFEMLQHFMPVSVGKCYDSLIKHLIMLQTSPIQNFDLILLYGVHCAHFDCIKYVVAQYHNFV